ncbi:auxin-induced protein 10A5 [Rhodamnia argentea]|uniref:Auxin-induced protein 10A5 n=1 Tax=Rhodamnia argentea TaxID=178133 RepID=A0A8B8QXT6_9MYRT|nr:auxin-induced protein 10A5 [Rhodamnia argentea]
MAKLSRASGSKRSGIVKLKIVVEKLQKSLSIGRRSPSPWSSYYHREDDYESENGGDVVPDDVKEGHFAVVALEGDRPKRFVIPLSYLAHPTFLRLLEQAAEEYGFDREGALAIPCEPSELERILA